MLSTKNQEIIERHGLDQGATFGDNTPTIERALLSEIDEFYKPHYENIGAAKQATVAALVSYNRAQNGIVANQRCRLFLALADLAAHAAKEGEIVLNANAITSFRNYLKTMAENTPELAVTEINRAVAVNEQGDEVFATIDKVSVLEGIPTKTLTGAMELALLFAIGHKSQLQIGCLASAGNRQRFTDGDVWEPVTDRAQALDMVNKRSHYVGPGIPPNVYWPHKYVIVSAPGKPETLRFTGPNDDNQGLVFVTDELSKAMFLHFFAGIDYVLDDDASKNGGKRPTGKIIGVKRSEPPAANRQGGEGQGATPERTLAASVQRAAGFGTDSLASKLHDCAAAIVTLPINEWRCPPADVVRGALFCARAAVAAMLRKGEMARIITDDKVGPEWIALYNILNELTVEEDDEYRVEPDGASEFKLKDGEPLPLGVNPATAELVKGAQPEPSEGAEPEDHDDA